MNTAEFALSVIEARARRRKNDVRPIVRVLAIKNGCTKDEQGRAVGDDWILASFGADQDGTEYYLTTDRVHASEMLAVDGDLTGPKELVQLLAASINRTWRARVAKRRKP